MCLSGWAQAEQPKCHAGALSWPPRMGPCQYLYQQYGHGHKEYTKSTQRAHKEHIETTTATCVCNNRRCYFI